MPPCRVYWVLTVSGPRWDPRSLRPRWPTLVTPSGEYGIPGGTRLRRKIPPRVLRRPGDVDDDRRPKPTRPTPPGLPTTSPTIPCQRVSRLPGPGRVAVGPVGVLGEVPGGSGTLVPGGSGTSDRIYDNEDVVTFLFGCVAVGGRWEWE